VGAAEAPQALQKGSSNPTQATTHPPHLYTSIGSGYYTLKREEPLFVAVSDCSQCKISDTI